MSSSNFLGSNEVEWQSREIMRSRSEVTILHYILNDV